MRSTRSASPWHAVVPHLSVGTDAIIWCALRGDGMLIRMLQDLCTPRFRDRRSTSTARSIHGFPQLLPSPYHRTLSLLALASCGVWSLHHSSFTCSCPSLCSTSICFLVCLTSEASWLKKSQRLTVTSAGSTRWMRHPQLRSLQR